MRWCCWLSALASGSSRSRRNRRPQVSDSEVWRTARCSTQYPTRAPKPSACRPLKQQLAQDKSSTNLGLLEHFVHDTLHRCAGLLEGDEVDQMLGVELHVLACLHALPRVVPTGATPCRR